MDEETMIIVKKSKSFTIFFCSLLPGYKAKFTAEKSFFLVDLISFSKINIQVGSKLKYFFRFRSQSD